MLLNTEYKYTKKLGAWQAFRLLITQIYATTGSGGGQRRALISKSAFSAVIGV